MKYKGFTYTPAPKTAWDSLSMQEKSEMMKVAVRNGITDLKTIRERYNEFAEGGDTKDSWTMQDEASYRQWRDTLPDNLRNTNDNDYDMRAAFKAGMQPVLESDGYYHLGSRDPKTGRILKAPHHPTFLQALATDASMGYYPITDNKGQTYTQTWKGNAFAEGGDTKQDEKRSASTISNMVKNGIAYFLRTTPKYPVSSYKPTKGNGDKTTYYAIPELRYDVARNISKMPLTKEPLNTFNDVYNAHKGGVSRQMDSVNLGNYRVDTGFDERGRYISFYDKYDWNLLEELGLGGKPFEIYDRIYEDEWPVYINNVDAVTKAEGGKIYIKSENRGKFTALKERTGHSASWFKEHGTPAQKKMAVFALNSRHWKHGLGGNLFEEAGQMKVGKKGRYWIDNSSILPEFIVTPSGTDYVRDEAGNPAITVGTLKEINPNIPIYERSSRELKNNQYNTELPQWIVDQNADNYANAVSPGIGDFIAAGLKPFDATMPSRWVGLLDSDNNKGLLHLFADDNRGFYINNDPKGAFNKSFHDTFPLAASIGNLAGDAITFPSLTKGIRTVFRRGESIRTPQITAENAASITPEVTHFYHGSPVRFDNFSADFIGSGEGGSKVMRGINLWPEEKIANAPKFANIKSPDAPLHLGVSSTPLGGKLNPTVYDVSGRGLKLYTTTPREVKGLSQSDLISQGYDGIQTPNQVTVFPESIGKLSIDKQSSIEDFVMSHPEVERWTPWTTDNQKMQNIIYMSKMSKWTPAQWTAAQDAAIARGDKAEALRLRGLHFKVSAPNTAQQEIMYNASGNSVFNEFNGGKTGLNWFSDSEKYAANHGVPRAFYINEPDIYLGNVPAWVKGAPANKRYIESLKKLGYTDEQIAQKIREINEAANSTSPAAKSVGMGANNELVTKNNNTAKLANAVTYDDNGVRIPLGERDNFNINDIRYGLLPFLGLGAAGTLYRKQD